MVYCFLIALGITLSNVCLMVIVILMSVCLSVCVSVCPSLLHFLMINEFPLSPYCSICILLSDHLFVNQSMPVLCLLVCLLSRHILVCRLSVCPYYVSSCSMKLHFFCILLLTVFLLTCCLLTSLLTVCLSTYCLSTLSCLVCRSVTIQLYIVFWLL